MPRSLSVVARLAVPSQGGVLRHPRALCDDAACAVWRGARAWQAEIEAVELRVTDHVLLGTDEEAERMASASGPDGDRLRELCLRRSELAGRQRLQKALLVQVARRALIAHEAHNERIRALRERADESARVFSLFVAAFAELFDVDVRLQGNPPPGKAVIEMSVREEAAKRAAQNQKQLSPPDSAPAQGAGATPSLSTTPSAINSPRNSQRRSLTKLSSFARGLMPASLGGTPRTLR